MATRTLIAKALGATSLPLALPWAAGAPLTALHAASFWPFCSDDAFISLRYAQRFAEGQGLTWNPGERVEGYSNLLWVVLTAALGKLTGDYVLAVRILGGLCTAATLAVVVHFAAQQGGRLAPWVAAGLFAASAPLAVWTIGGLEQPLVALLLAIATTRLAAAPAGPDTTPNVPHVRVFAIAGTALALLCLTRPDSPLWAALLGAPWLLPLWRRRAWRQALALAGPPVMMVLAHTASRLAYYGDWVPNTAYVKASLSWTRLVQGASYAGSGLLAIAPAAGLAAWGALREPKLRPMLFATAGWLLYITFVGGDIFPAWRHFVPVLVCLIPPAALAAAALPRRHWLAPMALAAFLALQLTGAPVARAHKERWEWNAVPVAKTLHRLFPGAAPLMAADAAGALPFFARYPTIDMLGLNDRHIARHRPPGWRPGHLAHDLGDGAYVLGRKPDIVVFCTPQGKPAPCFRSGHEMVRMPEFQRDYRLVRVPTGRKGLTLQMFVRESSPFAAMLNGKTPR